MRISRKESVTRSVVEEAANSPYLSIRYVQEVFGVDWQGLPVLPKRAISALQTFLSLDYIPN
jgi:hypothetical protein